jgi:hypothetical protein
MDKTPVPQYYPVTKDELNFIKNDCMHPETDSCEGCELDTPEGCTFVGANILMDEVLSRPPISASSDVLDELMKWLYEEGMKFEKICDSEANFVNATGACARRAQCYYTIEKLKELRQQTKEREQR